MKIFKKALAVLLSALMCASLFGCGETPTASVETEPETTLAPTASTEEQTEPPTEETMESTEAAQEPIMEERFTEAPNYTLKEGATTDEIRAMAVQAMYDLITVPWYTRVDWNYSKSGVGSGKVWEYERL